ncbi:MAG: shikimate kinase [Clostridia bacterium]|nr:shikimate kinase [Clostridia bacterium]
MEKKNNVILIGMPGAGKTTIGTELAERIGYGYVDVDSVIIAREGKCLNEIIAECGRENFLDIEAKVNSELCAERCVIATGGSVVYRESAMEKLRALGKIVYLQLPYAEIERRLGDLKQRGVALKDGFTLRDLYEERIPLYEKYAEITVDLAELNVAECVEKVAKAVQNG